MLFRGLARVECSKVLSLSRFGILLLRVKAIFARLEFSDHDRPYCELIFRPKLVTVKTRFIRYSANRQQCR